MIDLTALFGAIITVAVGLIVYKFWPYMIAKVGEDKMNQALFWVKIAVSAAEQVIQGTKMGTDRKAWVKKFLNDRGFDADLDWLDAMIESEVKKLNQKTDN